MDIIRSLLNNISLDERIEDGIFNVENNDHIGIMREYLVKKGISESDAMDFTNRVVEAGKYPERQAYNKNGILVTFPTPQHKQKAIRRRTHFEKDPTKGKPNLFATDPETGQPKRPPGRPRKDDKEKGSGGYTPPADGGGQSIEPSTGASSLSVSGTDASQSPGVDDTDTTTAAPVSDDDAGSVDQSVEQGPPDVLPPKPEKEKEQDKKAISKMMASKNTALGTPMDTDPVQMTPMGNNAPTDIEALRKHLKESLDIIEHLRNIAMENE